MMKDFPEDIIDKILSHVSPLESVLNCKLVCKQWRKLLGHTKVGFLIALASYSDELVQLFYADYEEICSSDPDTFCYTTSITKIDHPPMDMGETGRVIVGSCNGLVCLAKRRGSFEDPVYIFNPITRECTSLPTWNTEGGGTTTGFGYHRSSNEYKVVRILYPNRYTHNNHITTEGMVQVYTLGKGVGAWQGWRNLKPIPNSLFGFGILANGSLHWKDENDHKILAFDLAKEEFRVLPAPPCIRPGEENIYSYKLEVLGGYLCLVDQVDGEYVDIWFFKNSRQPQYESGYEADFHSWSWNQEVRIEWEQGSSKDDIYEPFAITKSGEILLQYNIINLCCYDPKNKVLNFLVVGATNSDKFQIMPHTNTLVSLKDQTRRLSVGLKCKCL